MSCLVTFNPLLPQSKHPMPQFDPVTHGLAPSTPPLKRQVPINNITYSYTVTQNIKEI